MKKNLDNVLFDWDDANGIKTECYEGFARFSIVKKYELLYKEEWKRFKRAPKVYALPNGKKPSRIYNGLDRPGFGCFGKLKRNLTETQRKMIEYVQDDLILSGEDLMLSEKDAKMLLSCFKKESDYELVWSRISGSTEEIPEGYQFVGYDITYPPEDDGAFSMINDCMFICRWHGCDEEGTLFAENFAKLNADGLFRTFEDAYEYMIKYRKEDWTETGSYGIFEIYMKKKATEVERLV